MADHNKPTITSNYLDFVNEMHGRMDDLAVGFDPARTSATNVPNYSIRWSSVAKKWQYLDGSSWKDLTNEYAINISGSAAKLKTARTISITGGGTAQPVPFDGSADVQLTLESLDLDNLTGLGTAATRNVGESSGNVMEVGAFGLGRITRVDYPADSLDTVVESGFYYAQTSKGFPFAPDGHVLMISYSAVWACQIAFDYRTSKTLRRSSNNGVWTNWEEFLDTGNILKTTGNNDNYPMSQKAVTDALNTKNTQGTGSSQTRTNSQNDSRFIQGGSVVQGTGSSTTDVMSQKAVSDQLLGVGQTWRSVNRGKDTTYTNTTGRSICVSAKFSGIKGGSSGSNVNENILVDGNIVARSVVPGGDISGDSFLFTVVPNGSTYRFTTTAASTRTVIVSELR